MANSRYSIVAICTATAAMFASFAVAARDAACALLEFGQRWLETAIETIADSRPALALDGGSAFAEPALGRAIDRALQNDMRHESRIARRAAHRNI